MPMHDWTRVSAGTYHDFHGAWITHLKESLNAGLLPSPYYAMGEQHAGSIQGDVVALRTNEYERESGSTWEPGSGEGMVAVAEASPRVSLHQEALEDVEFLLQRQRTIAIRGVSGDRVVALIEIVSPANKHSRESVDDFVDKVVASLKEGIHVLIVDPLPPRRHDPAGMHAAVFDRMLAGNYDPPAGRPLTLVAYHARTPIDAWIEPFAVGDALIEMPLFLTREHYVRVPLEPTYSQAYRGVPQRWKRVIEASE